MLSKPPPRNGARRMACTVLLLVPLLAACGAGAAGGSPQSSGTAATSSAGMANSAPPPQATSAPAAAAATAAPAMSAMDSTAAPAMPASGPSGNPTADTPPERSAEQQAPLKAGEIDDNAEFAAYESYLSSYRYGQVTAVDVSERYILSVRDAQQRPVLGAQLTIFGGANQVFTAKTTGAGKTIFFPRAAGVADGMTELRMEVTKGNQTVTGVLRRGQDSSQELTLPDAAQTGTPKLDVLFLLDTTGSMGDEIYQLQQAIRSIADQVDALSPRPELRFGLVAYRDQGDDYVTRAYDFTPDVAAFRETLSGMQADGGGDDPEALTEALHAAVNDVAWAEGALRLTFLVADAPPHVRANDQNSYVREIRNAVTSGIKIYPIAASNTSKPAEYVFRQMAQQTLGRFIFLTYQSGQAAGAPGDTTTMNVDPEAFSSDRLDDIVVHAIRRELAEAAGAA